MSIHFWDILMTYLQTLSDEQSIYLQLSFIMFLPRPSTLYLCPLQIMCLTRYIDGESLRNGMFTICQIGFIGTVIQWWSLMQWYSVKWILPYYGHSSAVIYVISPRPDFKHAGIVPVHVNILILHGMEYRDLIGPRKFYFLLPILCPFLPSLVSA
jgi:hypothetical protein